MPDMYNCLPPGAGKAVNKKQVQDFIKEQLFEISWDELNDLLETKYAGLTGFSMSIIQTINEVSKSGDFLKLKPLLDFAFEKEVKVKK